MGRISLEIKSTCSTARSSSTNVTTVMGTSGATIADAFTRKVEPEVVRIQAAAAQAIQAANDYAYQAARGVNQAAIMALVVSMAVAVVVVFGALRWYVPSRADMDADHAEAKRMEGVIQMLKEHGGLA